MRTTTASRRGFFQAAGGTAALGALIAGCGSKKSNDTTPGGSNKNTGAGTGTDQFGRGDLGVAGYALTLEYVESSFYAVANKSGHLKGQAAQLARSFAKQESEHVKTLESEIRRLGGQPPPKPQTTFQTGSAQSILQIAVSLEGLAAGAYLALVDRIEDRKLLDAVLSIHTVEGRHAAAFASVLGQDPAEQGAFAQPVTVPDALNRLHTLEAT